MAFSIDSVDLDLFKPLTLLLLFIEETTRKDDIRGGFQYKCAMNYMKIRCNAYISKEQFIL